MHIVSPLRSKLLPICLGLIAALAFAPLAAQERPRDRAQLRERLLRADEDRDGAWNRRESEKHFPGVGKRFDLIDRNADGVLTPKELRDADAMRRGRAEQFRERAWERFHRADRDGDGTITRDEARQGLPGVALRFDDIDANRDGRLTPEEFREYRLARSRARQLQEGDDDPRD